MRADAFLGFSLGVRVKKVTTKVTERYISPYFPPNQIQPKLAPE